MTFKKGHKHSEETIKKIKEARARQVITKESIKKMSETRKGMKFSKEWRRRLSESHKGLNTWRKGKPSGMLGKKQSEYQKQRIRESHLGREVSKETRIKMSLGKTGEKEFKGFKTDLIRLIRFNKKYLTWRSNIFKRDNYHCQNCGEKGYLEAHHIIPLSLLVSKLRITNVIEAVKCEPLWAEGNGITYCRPCHILLDPNICIKKNKHIKIKIF